MTVFRGKKESDWKLPKTELMNYFQMMKIWAMYGEMWLLQPYLNNCIVCCVSDIMKAQRKMCLILLRWGAGESHINRWLWLKWGKCVWSLPHSLKCPFILPASSIVSKESDVWGWSIWKATRTPGNKRKGTLETFHPTGLVWSQELSDLTNSWVRTVDQTRRQIQQLVFEQVNVSSFRCY